MSAVAQPAPAPSAPAAPPAPAGLLALRLLAAASLWLAVYATLPTTAHLLTRAFPDALGPTALGAIEFFFFEAAKVLLLLVAVIFSIGIVRTFFTPERTRALLARRGGAPGNVLAALLGVVTPFCSCSAVPLFVGFLGAGVPLGVTFSFLVAAPMVNEVALVLLFGLFGARVAGLYLATGLAVAIVAGWTIGRFGLERWVEAWVLRVPAGPSGDAGAPRMRFADRVAAGRLALREVLGKVWPYLLAGIAVGAGIHGWVPTGALAGFMGRDAWWSVPLAVLLGVPMYSNAAGMIPVVEALLAKGAALGTALAFMMAVVALSLPEAILLRRVLRPRLLAVFFGTVAAGIMLVGLLFNAVL